MTSIADSLRDYIASSLLSDGQGTNLHDDDDLLMILDSLQVLRMLLDLEAKYSIKVDNSELTPENLGTIERLAALIARKVSAC
jgi:acyl carrier protein